MSTFKGFTTVQMRKPERSKFDLSHEKRLSTRMGKLTPVFFSETLPNDTFRVNTEIMLRMAPMLAPIMHRVNVFVHFFFIPMRLLWADWEDFITNGRLGTETVPQRPIAHITAIQALGLDLLDQGSLADYLGCGSIPDGAAYTAGVGINLTPFAAYYKVWYDYYRDRNYVADNDNLPLLSGLHSSAPIITDTLLIKNRDWQKDYFTSALPWTQRGDEVLMPLQGTGVVTYLPTSKVWRTDEANFANAVRQLGTSTGSIAEKDLTVDGLSDGSAAGVAGRIENIDEVTISTSDVSINDLRRSVRLQEWLERNALAGSRYTESILAHFARRSSDGRLQRAEYLGGGKVTVKISEIVTTAWSVDGDTNDVPPANMAGHGLSFGNTNRFTYNCEEHGYVIGIMSCMPNSSYMQGTHRMFFHRATFLDYPWPSFAHLGEQEVYDYEIFQDPLNTPLASQDTWPSFGYQSRYADWKYIASSSHGDFKGNLDFWHLTRKFSSTPALGADFCTFEDTLQDRIFAVSETDTLWCYIYNNASVVRSLPYYGTPML